MASKTAHGFLAVGFLCVSGVECTLSYFIAALAGGLLPDFDLVWKHRKILHNIFIPLALAAVGLAGIVSDPTFAYILALGWISHLVSDAVTKRGVAFFWPLNGNHYHLAPKSVRPKSSSVLYNGSLILLSILMVLWRTGLFGLFR